MYYVECSVEKYCLDLDGCSRKNLLNQLLNLSFHLMIRFVFSSF